MDAMTIDPESQVPPDSNAVALDRRNFGSLPGDLATDWASRFLVVKDKEVPLPKKAIIELANTCNLDCPMCRVGQYGINLRRTLPLHHFARVLDELPSVEIVRLNGLGESTLVPDFQLYLEALSQRSIRTELISNGSGKKEHYDQIIRDGGKVIVSWDAATGTVFEKLRRPAKWDAYVGHLKAIKALAKQASRCEAVSLLFTLQPANIGHLEKLVTLCVEWGVRHLIVNSMKNGPASWIQRYRQEIEADFSRATEIASKNQLRLVVPSEIDGTSIRVPDGFTTCAKNCSMPWKEISIRWNGDVEVCNMFTPFTYGNIHLNSIPTIWRSRFAALFRDRVNSAARHPYCRGCVYVPAAYS